MDELYLLARRVLLDALHALWSHRSATILVGAQAVYLQTGRAEFAVAEYTTDADIAIDPALLDPFPPIELSLMSAGFERVPSNQGVGVWKTRRTIADSRELDVQVDLLVPSSVGFATGRRAARLSGHHALAARKVNGLEGALVDQVHIEIGSLEPEHDPRRIVSKVAGPGALLVAKLFKIEDRIGTSRANDKDALDVLRLLQCIPTSVLASSLSGLLRDGRSSTVTARAMVLLERLFGTRGSDGAIMAARAARPLMDERQSRLACEVLTGDLIRKM